MSNSMGPRQHVSRSTKRGVDIDQLARDVRLALVQAVPFDSCCLSAVDPATLLPTRCAVDNDLPLEETMRLYELEASRSDVGSLIEHTTSGSAAGPAELTPSADDHDRRGCALRLAPLGLGEELRAALTTATATWGALTLRRGGERPPFSETEVRFVASLATPLAEGVRRVTLVRRTTGDAPDDTGLVVLRPDDTVASANHAGDRWLDELEAGERCDRAVADGRARRRRAGATDRRRSRLGARTGTRPDRAADAGPSSAARCWATSWTGRWPSCSTSPAHLTWRH